MRPEQFTFATEMRLEDFQAIIYDMDGVLTDSEPIWKIAMEDVFHGVGCNLTHEDFQKTTGLRIDEVCLYWHSVQPWEQYTPKQVETLIVDRMAELLAEQAEPLEGVVESLKFFKSCGKRIGLATSSYSRLIDVILSKLEIREFFDTIHSAENELFGKPHPAVYLTAAEHLGVFPQHCLVIEDSLNGVISAKAARMSVICVPEKTHLPDPRLILADAKFDSLTNVIDYFKVHADSN